MGGLRVCERAVGLNTVHVLLVTVFASLSQLARRVKEVRQAAGVVQRLYQVHFWQVDDNDLDGDLHKQAIALHRDYWEIKKEYETFQERGDPKELVSKPAARLATNFTKLCSDVGRVKWYEEDAHSNARRVRQLELELSATKQKVEDLETRLAQRSAIKGRALCRRRQPHHLVARLRLCGQRQ